MSEGSVGSWLNVVSVLLAVPAGVLGWKSLLVKKLRREEMDNMDQNSVVGIKEFWERLALKYPEQGAFKVGEASEKNYLKSKTKIDGGWFALLAAKTKTELVFYIDTGDVAGTLRMYEDLKKQKVQIESELGAKLEWQDKNGCRAKRVTWRIDGLTFKNEADREKIIDEFCNRMPKFEAVFKKYVGEIKS